MKRVAVLTSGGDAPGMNAAIRAVVRAGLDHGYEMLGVRRGYVGLLEGNFLPMTARAVGGIIQQGGTMLGSARCTEFRTDAGHLEALERLELSGIEALIVIGGNGSQTGAYNLSQRGFPVIGIASTIDNDLYGTEMTIGVDTALNIALEAIDRLKTTASSHKRGFLVEVMGRDCGYLALMSGIAGGAEVIAIPEAECDPEQMAKTFAAGYDRGKSHAIGVIAEGAHPNADEIVAYFREHEARTGFDLRLTKLGHVQRGGAPLAFDRLLATRFGAHATQCLAAGEFGILVGLNRGEITTTPLAQVVSHPKTIDLSLLSLARVLAK
jgi:6-phosphofructokinase 1